MIEEQKLQTVYRGILDDVEYRADRQRDENTKDIKRKYGALGFLRPAGLMQRELRLTDESYYDAVRDGIVQALQTVEGLKLDDYRNDLDLQWLERAKYFDWQLEDIDYKTQLTITAMDVDLERLLSTIRLDAERSANIIELDYTKQAKIIDINGDAQARLLALDYEIRTDQAVSNIELGILRELQAIDLDARFQASTIDLGYQRQAKTITLGAQLETELAEADAKNTVAIRTADAKLGVARLESDAELAAAQQEGNVKIEGVTALSDTRNTVAQQSGTVKLEVRRLVNDTRLTQGQRENDARIANLYRKSDAAIADMRDKSNARLSASTQINEAELQTLTLKLDSRLQIQGNKADTQYQLELAEANAKQGILEAEQIAKLSNLTLKIDANYANEKRLSDAKHDNLTIKLSNEFSNSEKKITTNTEQDKRLSDARYLQLELNLANKAENQEAKLNADYQADTEVKAAHRAEITRKAEGRLLLADEKFKAQLANELALLDGRLAAQGIAYERKAEIRTKQAADTIALTGKELDSKAELSRARIDAKTTLAIGRNQVETAEDVRQSDGHIANAQYLAAGKNAQLADKLAFKEMQDSISIQAKFSLRDKTLKDRLTIQDNKFSKAEESAYRETLTRINATTSKLVARSYAADVVSEADTEKTREETGIQTDLVKAKVSARAIAERARGEGRVRIATAEAETASDATKTLNAADTYRMTARQLAQSTILSNRFGIKRAARDQAHGMRVQASTAESMIESQISEASSSASRAVSAIRNQTSLESTMSRNRALAMSRSVLKEARLRALAWELKGDEEANGMMYDAELNANAMEETYIASEMNARFAGEAEKLSIMNSSRINTEGKINYARLVADEVRVTASMYARRMAQIASADAQRIRLEAEAQGHRIRSGSNANKLVNDAYWNAERAVTRQYVDAKVALYNKSQTHINYNFAVDANG